MFRSIEMSLSCFCLHDLGKHKICVVHGKYLNLLSSLHNDLSFVSSLVLLSQLPLHFAVTPAITMFALRCKL